MSKKRTVGYWLYYSIRRRSSDSVIKALGGSSLLRPLRDLILRSSNKSKIQAGEIRFEGLRFYFAAPFNTFYRAHAKGIEARISRLIMGEVSYGSVCVDVGANYGFLTVILGLRCAPHGRVISFEPVPEIVEVLNGTIQKNQLQTVCRIIPLALGSSNTRDLTTLDTVLMEQQIDRLDFLKIDVDGSDLDVLLGAESAIQQHHPILVVEMVKNQKRIYDFVVRQGYRFIVDMENNPVVIGYWPPNLIASTKKLCFPSRGAFTRTEAQEQA